MRGCYTQCTNMFSNTHTHKHTHTGSIFLLLSHPCMALHGLYPTSTPLERVGGCCWRGWVLLERVGAWNGQGMHTAHLVFHANLVHMVGTYACMCVLMQVHTMKSNRHGCGSSAFTPVFSSVVLLCSFKGIPSVFKIIPTYSPTYSPTYYVFRVCNQSVLVAHRAHNLQSTLVKLSDLLCFRAPLRLPSHLSHWHTINAHNKQF